MERIWLKSYPEGVLAGIDLTVYRNLKLNISGQVEASRDHEIRETAHVQTRARRKL